MADIDVMKASKWTRRAIIGACRSSGCKEKDDVLWKATLEEKEQHWLSGPFEESELTRQLGPLWVVSSRFGLEQGKKLRPVDSMSEPFINAAFRAREKLNLQGVDQLAALTSAILGSVSNDRRVDKAFLRCDLKGLARARAQP